MKDFLSDLVTEMTKALEIPDKQEFHNDRNLLMCIDVYGTKIFHERRERSLFVTFLALMDCHNRYEDVLEKVKEIAEVRGYKSVKPNSPKTIETYRSNIVSYLKSKLKDQDLPECALRWKEEIRKVLEDGINK